MRGDEIDALERPVGVFEIVGKEVVAAVEPLHQRTHASGNPAHKIAEIVAVLAVPLAPVKTRERAAQQVAFNVPGLGDHADAVARGEKADI